MSRYNNSRLAAEGLDLSQTDVAEGGRLPLGHLVLSPLFVYCSFVFFTGKCETVILLPCPFLSPG